MFKTALRYALYGIYVIIAIFIITLLVADSDKDFKIREIAGWGGIFLSVVFVFFGLKYYRDKQNGGALSFGEGLKLGLLIVLFPAFAFGILSVIQLAVDPEHNEQYYAYKLDELRKTAPASELAARIKDMEETKELFKSPFVQFIAMFLSVFIVGLIVTVISTLILKRKKQASVG